MTRRPVLPGASELFRRTDRAGDSLGEQPRDQSRGSSEREAADRAAEDRAADLRADARAAARAAAVTELPTLAAAAASPSLRGRAAGRAPEEGSPLTLVPPAVDALAAHRSPAPRVAAPTPPPTRGRPTVERPKHEEKITVYCSAEELLALEQARLTLRGEHGVVADRGRIVRTAIQVLLADLAAQGEDSILVQRLRTR